MIKVLQIITDSNIGGAGRLLINYLHNFDKTKFDMAVVLPRGADLKPLVEAEGFAVIETEHGRDKSFEVGAVSELCRIFKEFKPDLVHCHSSLSAKIAAYLCRVPARLYSRHCVFPQPKRLTTFPGKQICGFVNNTLSTHIVAVAKAAMDNLTEIGVDPKKVTVIINGVEEMERITDEEKAALRKQLDIGETDFVCAIPARLEIYKGHTYMLEAAALLKDEYPDMKFLIIGGGTIEEDLKREAEELGISHMVRFTGFVNRVAPYYNIMDLNINCSIGTETSSLSLSEGMSLGVPAVASDFGGNPYMVTDGWNGFIVPQKDPKALAEAIRRIAGDPALLERLSKGAREAYEKKFTAAGMTRQMEELYLRAVEETKR